jgi:hypothetical protein
VNVGTSPIVARMWHPADEFAEDVGEPFLYTFTAPLPFPLGIPNTLGHTIRLHESFADPEDTELFGPVTEIDIRAFTFEEDGLEMWPPGINEALDHFFGHDFDADPDERYGEGNLASGNQWVSFETPAAPTVEELKVPDPVFAFHRCLVAFDLFLRGVAVATGDIRIRPISSHDLRPVVVVGARRRDRSWQLLSTMKMHPEAAPDPLLRSEGPITEEQLNGALHAVQSGKPYMTTMLWRMRAQRALRQEGDFSNAIISFQVAAESLLFDTYRMILVDDGMSSTEITAELEGERSFRSLMTTTMPERLGGRWDVKAAGTPVGEYWLLLYRIRNAIVHTGYEPHGGEAEAAQEAYRGLYRHLEDRLRANPTKYPRTVYARLGEDGLRRRGVLSRRLKKFLTEVEAEADPWYWPHDLAGRKGQGSAST